MTERISITDWLKPGQTCAIVGRRGGGKSSTCTSLCEMYRNKDPNVYIVTNVQFIHKTAAGERLETPDRVYFVNTIEGVFRTISKIMQIHLKTHKSIESLRILWVCDEAQMYLSGSDSTKGGAPALKKTWGLLRKFRCGTLLICPVLNSLLPIFRADLNSGGYLTNILIKNDRVRVPGNGDPRDFVWVKDSTKGGKAIPIYIPQTSWCKPDNEWHYDHLGVSSLDLEPKSNFTLDKMVDAISNVMSVDVPSALANFFKNLDGGSSEGDPELPPAEDNLYNCDMDWIKALRDAGVGWKIISEITGVKNNALQQRMNNWLVENPARKRKIGDINGRNIKVNTR